jgi:hypothetical protein
MLVAIHETEQETETMTTNAIVQSIPTSPPRDSEYFEYYGTYVSQVPEGNLISLAEAQIDELKLFFERVTEAQATVLHAPYTWTIKQVVGHLIDADRFFADRLHRFASRDFQPLNSMDQDIYVANLDYQSPSLASLVEELGLCRLSNVLLLRRLPPGAWDQCGIASDHPITVRALAYIQVGHITYHLKILRKRLSTASLE